MTELFLLRTDAPRRTRRHVLIRLGALLATFAMASVAHAQQLDRPDGTEFRYLTWNVARENFVDQAAAIRQVLNVIDADVILFDELPEPVTDASLAAFAASLDHGPYLSVLGKGGGSYQRAAVLARTPLTRVKAFDVLKYPTDVVNRWLNGAGEMREVLSQNLDLGIPTAAADVQMGPGTLMVVGLDLQCCGNTPGAWEEERRRVESTAIRSALDAHWQQQAAVIVSGDFNNVQGMTPIDLISGLGNATTDRQLARAEALHLDGQTDWTWDGRGTEFPSRAMDHVLYSSALEALNATVFDTEVIDAETRAKMGLDVELSKQCSDHRPIFVDFRWRATKSPD